MKHRKRAGLILILLTALFTVVANPLLPGYYADPTIKKFGDTYYIYATTDGIKLASGEPSVWVSNDLKNWVNVEMEMSLPDGLTNCWAPDVLEGKDGRYYYYMGNCQFGCNIYGYVSNSPVGPWVPLNEGKPVIPVGTGKEHLPALDAQFFQDDDGSLYAFFGTWCTSFGGMGWVKINSDDMFTIEEEGFIPISQIPRAFEAAYMMKKNDTYILMYSAGDCKLDSYAVHYAYSDKPTGPFTYGENNPILSSDGALVDGPGHHSVLEDDGEYFIVYHRHDNPHSTGGMFRQTCVDKLTFINDHTIAKVEPTEDGLYALGVKKSGPENLALGAKAEATSYYHLKTAGSRFTGNKAVDYAYSPSNATDGSNNTLWKADGCELPQSLTIDLGKTQSFDRISTDFEYPSHFYQYKTEISKDGKNWSVYAEKTNNKVSGSPVTDQKKAKARFIRITVTDVEKPGLYAGIWNVNVTKGKMDIPEFQQMVSNADKAPQPTGECLVDISFKDQEPGQLNDRAVLNKGTLKGEITGRGNVEIKNIDGVMAAVFDGKSSLRLAAVPPESMAWNAPFTTAVWVKNPEIGHGECLLSWTSRRDMLQASYAAMYYGTGNYGAAAHGDGAVDMSYSKVPEADKWHHIAVTFDGMTESIYVDGKLDKKAQLMLFVTPAEIHIGASGNPDENFSGSISGIRLYNKSMTEAEIKGLLSESNPFTNAQPN
ncbi:family 43 glycosylhydrolase [Saccharicrinis sp. FJH54]|uniref:family 43 glycosylhydrolase n=1 Tax=Saccharicrinis sp. FJH54 TaxID=3344665 RepID=UPI0035D4AAE3